MSTDHYFDQWEWKVWKADPRVRRLSPASRCIWFEVLGDMWLDGLSHWQGSAADLARAAGASEAEAETFIADAQRIGVCDVSRESNGSVTLTCRRRVRELSAKENNRLRQQRHRRKGRDNGHVTGEGRAGHGGEVRDQKNPQDQHSGETCESSRQTDLSGPAGPPANLWQLGKQFLGSERLFGKLIREHGEDGMRAAIMRTLEHGAGEPKSFLIGCLKGEGNGTRQADSGRASAADRVREGALRRHASRTKG